MICILLRRIDLFPSLISYYLVTIFQAIFQAQSVAATREEPPQPADESLYAKATAVVVALFIYSNYTDHTY